MSPDRNMNASCVNGHGRILKRACEPIADPASSLIGSRGAIPRQTHAVPPKPWRSKLLIVFVLLAVAFRIVTLAISIRNERRLKARGAVEAGAVNSAMLALAHIAFYVAAIGEGFSSGGHGFDAAAILGLAIYLFGAAMLIVVIRSLGRFWTVKLILAPDHELVANPLFRWVRHPNYFLNLLPELIGFALALHAFNTLWIGLPLYLVPLIIRIWQEENAMRARFPAY
jgi:isoprenylcysteine carboxyl methyltransferase (ICMT) family protein YpbQ